MVSNVWRIGLLVACIASAQKYTGPRPPKPDIPYIKHASNLLPTEVGEAKEEKRKNDTLYAVAGAASPTRTPLAEPIFIMEAKQVAAEKLQLYKMDVKSGRRELLMPERQSRQPRPKHMTWERLGPGLFKVEVNEPLEIGEYCLSPAGSNQVFCFQVY